MLFFLIALLGIVISVLVCGAYVFVAACVRARELPWFDKDKLEKTPFGGYYDIIVSADRWLREKNTDSVYITSDDGLRLHGLWIPAEKPIGTMVLVHGYRSTKLVDFGASLPWFYDAGFNLLIPDQRCHGESEGHYITFGVKESEDILRWVEYHNNNFGKGPVIINGLSMGASTVMYLADKDIPDNVRGLVADCGFTSPESIIRKVFQNATHLPGVIAVWAAGLYARIFAGFGFGQKDARNTLKKCKTPILLIHGTGDDFVPCEMSKQAFDACTGNKKLLLIEGAAHGAGFLVDRKKYTDTLRNFFESIL